ncbi:Uncharacterised protein [Serratia proteamaculans]|nr:Uncharacterised protein [Serratia proteamaculans]
MSEVLRCFFVLIFTCLSLKQICNNLTVYIYF